MSVVRYIHTTPRENFKPLSESLSILNTRDSRNDFVPMSIQYMKRSKNGSTKQPYSINQNTTTTMMMGNNNTPLRPPRSSSMFPLTTQTVSSSAVSSLIYKALTSEQFCWKLRDYYNKNKPIFPKKTKILFMPGGNVFEDYVLTTMQRLINKGSVQRQFNRDEIPRVYEKDLLSRLGRQNYVNESRDGFSNQISEDLTLFGRRIICRTDGLLPDYILEAKVPFGKLYKEHGSGTIIKEDGSKEYDKTKEIFEIPIHYKLQMLIQMNCYKRKKGYFGQYYIFKNWKSFTDLLKTQYLKLDRGATLMAGEVIYKSSLDKTQPIWTIIERIVKIVEKKVPVLGDAEKALLTSKEKTARANQQKEYKKDGRDKVWEFIRSECDYRIQRPTVSSDKEIKDRLDAYQARKELENTEAIREQIAILKIQLLKSYSSREKTAVEEVFRRNPQWLDNIIKNTTFENLTTLTTSTQEKKQILYSLEYGNKNDMRRGVVTFNGKIMWDGDDKESPFDVAKPEVKGMMKLWIKDLFRIVLPRVSRKDPTKWKAFEDEVRLNNNLDLSLYPDMNSFMPNMRGYGEYNEIVILEMDMTETYDKAMEELKAFLKQCDRTVKYRIPCKTLRKKDPISKEAITEKMTSGKMGGINEKIGYRERFMTYLKGIPVKVVAREEERI